MSNTRWCYAISSSLSSSRLFIFTPYLPNLNGRHPNFSFLQQTVIPLVHKICMLYNLWHFWNCINLMLTAAAWMWALPKFKPLLSTFFTTIFLRVCFAYFTLTTALHKWIPNSYLQPYRPPEPQCHSRFQFLIVSTWTTRHLLLTYANLNPFFLFFPAS